MVVLITLYQGIMSVQSSQTVQLFVVLFSGYPCLYLHGLIIQAWLAAGPRFLAARSRNHSKNEGAQHFLSTGGPEASVDEIRSDLSHSEGPSIKYVNIIP